MNGAPYTVIGVMPREVQLPAGRPKSGPTCACPADAVRTLVLPRHSAPQTRSHARAGPGGNEQHRSDRDAAEPCLQAPGVSARQPPRRAPRANPQARHLRAGRRRVPGSLDRRRQRRQSDARPRYGPRARDGSPAQSRRRPGPHRAPVAHRKRASRRYRRRGRPGSRVGCHRIDPSLESRQPSPGRFRPPGRHRPGLHVLRLLSSPAPSSDWPRPSKASAPTSIPPSRRAAVRALQAALAGASGRLS